MKNQSCLDSLLNQRKGSCFLKVSIQSLYSIKERVHAIQRYRYSLFAQLKKGSIIFNGINSVSLLSIKERVHAIQRIRYKQRWLCIQCHVPKKDYAFVSKNFQFFHFFNIFLLCNPFHVSERNLVGSMNMCFI